MFRTKLARWSLVVAAAGLLTACPKPKEPDMTWLAFLRPSSGETLRTYFEITSHPATAVANSRIPLGIRVTRAGAEVAYQLCLKPRYDYWGGATTKAGGSVAISGSTSSVTALLPTGLTNGTEYSVGLCATVDGYWSASTPEGHTTIRILAPGTTCTAPCSLTVNWAANRERRVNSVGGGYRVCTSQTSDFALMTGTCTTVPYVSGPTAPTTANVMIPSPGGYYVKVAGYTAINPDNSATAAELTVEAQ